jgi:DNA-directed RNA polymerase beta subunit
MTDHGTFVINGIERVIVPQLARSFGMFFTTNEIKGKRYFGAKIIPARGVWIEIESDADDLVYVKIDKKRKFSIISLFRVLGATDKQILEYFSQNDLLKKIIEINLAKDHTKTIEESYIEIYKKSLQDGLHAPLEKEKIDFEKKNIENTSEITVRINNTLIDPQNTCFRAFEAQHSRVVFVCFSFFFVKNTTMTVTMTAAQELLRGNAQIEALPVGVFCTWLQSVFLENH